MDNDFIEETKNRFSNFTATVNPLAPDEVLLCGSLLSMKSLTV